MPCDSQPFLPRQTLSERKSQVAEAIKQLDAALKKRRIRPVVGPQGAITFAGWSAEERAGVTDACAYRRLMVMGSSLAKAELARAEQLAGRGVSKQVVAAGVHSHDGGSTWHGKG